MRRLVLGIVALVAGSCSFTTAGNFVECKNDVDCGAATACSSGYCIPLPSGCKRDEAGGKRKAFEEESRIPLVALFPITTSSGAFDDSQVQSANAIKLAISEANDRLSPDRGFFGLFVCDTTLAPDAGGINAQAPWFITNLNAPAMFTANSGPTRELTLNAVRRDAGTLIISPNATSPELSVIFQEDPNVWRVAPPDNFQAQVLARVLAADLPDAGASRIAIIYPSPDSYGDGFANPLLEELVARGYTTSLHPYTEGDGNTHISAINGAVGKLPHASVIIGTPTDAVPIIERAKTFPVLRRSSGHRWYFTDSGKDVALITPNTITEIDGAFGTAPAQGAGAAFTTFRDVFTTRYSIDPNSTNFVSHSYDAAWLVMLAAQYAEGKEPADRTKITGPRLAEGMAKLSLSSGPATQLRADKWTELQTALSGGIATNVEGSSGQLDFSIDAGFAMSPYEVWQIADAGITVRRLMTP
ncbi:MAG: ABC transporter substrate-binding protein [Archangium sp.]|nr:ABC transporter substrate-binding protein [Archangium sp.]